jgi:flagellin-like hook-associated protein FlgL
MPMPLSGLAQTLSNSVATIQAQIVDTQNQLAAGVKTLNPGQEGVVTRLSAQANAYDQVTGNITAAQNVISVGQTALSSIATVLTQMKSLATQATSAGLTTSDTDALQSTFSSLATQVSNLGTGASVNGNNLLSSASGISVTTGIDGSPSAQTLVSGVDITSLARTASNLSITTSSASTATIAASGTTGVVTGSAITAGTSSVTTITTGGATPTSTFSLSGDATDANTFTISDGTNIITFNSLTGSGGALTSAQLATQVASYLTYGTFDATKLHTVTVGGVGQLAAFQANHSASVDSNGRLVITQTAAGRTGADNIITSGTKASAIVTTTVGVAADLVGHQSVDKVTFGGLSGAQSVTVGGLTFTANGSRTNSEVATAFYNYIHDGIIPASTFGSFTGSSVSAQQSLYSVGVAAGDNAFAADTAPAGAVLFYQSLAKQASTLTTGSSSIANAQAAIISLTTLLQTVSTGQSTLAASATGLTAQSSAANALKTGLTNTVNSIQNIDATAMQAKLQQLNNQQSIDYYLVSQMNTEAAAILSIFR